MYPCVVHVSVCCACIHVSCIKDVRCFRRCIFDIILLCMYVWNVWIQLKVSIPILYFTNFRAVKTANSRFNLSENKLWGAVILKHYVVGFHIKHQFTVYNTNRRIFHEQLLTYGWKTCNQLLNSSRANHAVHFCFYLYSHRASETRIITNVFPFNDAMMFTNGMVSPLYYAVFCLHVLTFAQYNQCDYIERIILNNDVYTELRRFLKK